jgi:hypothetical protein
LNVPIKNVIDPPPVFKFVAVQFSNDVSDIPNIDVDEIDM